MAKPQNVSFNPSNAKPVVKGYLNFYLPKADGSGKFKVGQRGIALEEGRAYDEAIAKRLIEDPESIKALMSKLQVEWVPIVAQTDEVEAPF